MRAGLDIFSPGGKNARLSILIFHRVLPVADPIFPEEMHAQRFDQVCAWLRRWFNVLPMDVAVERFRNNTLPKRACCISFDDGYADNLEVAAPILKKHQLSATFFIATGYLGGGRMWNDTVIESIRSCSLEAINFPKIGDFEINTAAQRRRAIDTIIGKVKYLTPEQRLTATEEIAAIAGVQAPDSLMMTADQVRAMRDLGMQIGAHTSMHPILSKISLQQAEQEICAGRDYLQDLLGSRVGLFAYPNGKPGEDYGPEHAALVRELGFDAAVSTAWGAADLHSDVYQLPRFTPWDQSKFRFGARLLRNLM
ncbi:polysaccharide deacetylase family protein [Paucibacter sp. B2R-40]|uniref:polysaccharide deacetylase family protein n=1 Tax=Paucibacter sp. B2R-40 TaxID=2893554 RepID=UPI0021E4D71D|nr:polysaccharide deacetylase family protein [Paucibacter sp. B2R-40]